MNKIKVLILGANGFVGQNLVRVFQSDESIDLYSTSRKPEQGQLLFDILHSSSWQNIAELKPDILIDASGYGVVKNQSDLNTLYQINYLEKREFIDFVFQNVPELFWIQIGTAFEYSLEQEALTEASPCFPKTHYGISKLLFSNYLQNAYHKRYTILRPFGMFGEGEDLSKFFPLLIQAQKEKRKIDLSDGSQFRDYFYINDLAAFILLVIKMGRLAEIENKVINVGSGKPETIRDLSNIIATQISDFDPHLWNWGAIPQRKGENNIFYNASAKARKLGFATTALEEAFKHTVNYYYNL